MIRQKHLAPLLLLTVLLGACGGNSTSTPGISTSSSISVTSSKSTFNFTSAGVSTDTPATTTYTFTNKAGGAAATVQSATIKYGTNQTLNVSFAGIAVPAGFSCSDGSTSGCSTANLQFTDSTLAKLLNDADLFSKLPSLNAGQTSIPLEVDFAGVSNPLNFTVNVGNTGVGGQTPVTPPAASPVPVITINGSATAPYSGNLNVTVSGNFDAASSVDRLILQTTDSTGNVDNTSYVSNQPTATFSVDTSKFPDGNVSLKAIAITAPDTKTGTVLRGESAIKAVAVQNITAPVIALASPTDGSTVTTTNMPVQVTVTRKNTAFSIPGNQMIVSLLDYRGQQVATQTITGVQDNVSGTYTTSFDVGGLPADIYTLSVKTSVLVAGTAPQTVTTIGHVTTKSVSLNPPASIVRFPIAITKADGSRSPAFVDSGSGFLATVSDNLSIQYVEARIVGPYAVGNIEPDGTKQCQSSGTPLGTQVNVLLLNVPGAALLPYQTQDVFVANLDIDGSTYVPDSLPGQRYDLRVTVADNEGNRNIQCVPVVIQRNSPRPIYTTSTSTTPGTLAKGPTFSSGTWTLGSVSNNSRVAAVLYTNGVQNGTSFFSSVQAGTISVSQNFAASGTYEVKWLVEDMGTGVVTTVRGGTINVGTNP